MVKITGREAVMVDYTPVSVVTRPAVHWAKAERLVDGEYDHGPHGIE